ncbi:MAG TPA: hypothetical protein VGH19_06890 [Verrucomicrobiae bacterium]
MPQKKQTAMKKLPDGYQSSSELINGVMTLVGRRPDKVPPIYIATKDGWEEYYPPKKKGWS